SRSWREGRPPRSPPQRSEPDASRQPPVHRRRQQKPGLPVYRAKVGHRKAPVIRRRINAIILARKRPRDAKSDRLLDAEKAAQKALKGWTPPGRIDVPKWRC